MNIKKKLIVFVMSFTMILSLIPIKDAQAAMTNDVKIISDSEVTVKQAKKWAKSKGATETFIDLADLYFEYSSKCGDVNPAIAYVQAAKETAYGKFGGVLDESYHNPCGLKIATAADGSDTDKNAHKKFNQWKEGVQAHLDHLALYAGANGYPKNDSYDQRQFRTIKGTATTINSLGGKWAPSSTYGEEVNQLYKDLLSYSGVKVEENVANNSNSNSSNNSSTSSSTPNPGIPEVKPSALNASKIIAINNSGTVENNSTNITSTIGWKNQNGSWYYYKSDNIKAKEWINPDNNWYYLKADGSMSTGWFNDNGTWYYFKNSGAMTKGWVQLNNAWYFLQGDGSMVTGLKTIDNKNYLFNNSGNMKTGWEKLNNYWYYFNVDGSMATGWINDSGSNYYLYDTGAMAKGWINLNGTWYYLKDSGTIVIGWVTSNGASYYLDTTGRMVTNAIIDGYKIGSDGKRQSSASQNDADTTNNQSKSKRTIVIDPGHNYGGDGGAAPIIDGVTYSETELNMQVSSKLKTELENRGYTVIMTRKENEKEKLAERPSLTKRINFANNSNADLFISIHHNSAGAEAQGIETYYSSKPQEAEFGGNFDSKRLEKSKQMAKDINNEIANKLNLKNRGSKDSDYMVCMDTKMPAVLVEVGFITNKEEAERCSNSSNQQKVAEAIAEVVSKNFK